MSAAVLIERTGHIEWITLNRPEAMNAINDDIRTQLPEAIRRADADTDVRVIVVRGAPGRAFCAGADVKGFGVVESLSEYRQSRVNDHWIRAFDETRKPVIASIHGYCLGGGLEIALACDIRIASSDATFALPEVTRGTIPGAGGTQRLAKVVGMGRALDMILTGSRITAEEALRLGVITRMSPADALATETAALAELVAGHAPLAVVFAKEAVRKGTDPMLDQGLKLELDLLTLLLSTEDRKEAGAAFREKRKPVFRGR